MPFGQIIERGMLSPGEQLWSLNGRHKAKVRADGTLIEMISKVQFIRLALLSKVPQVVMVGHTGDLSVMAR